VTFDGRSVSYGFGELDMLVPAYAATIHKSQGSEYPAVIIPLLTQHYPMQRLARYGRFFGKRAARCAPVVWNASIPLALTTAVGLRPLRSKSLNKRNWARQTIRISVPDLRGFMRAAS
jgi:hypothetical protein